MTKPQAVASAALALRGPAATNANEATATATRYVWRATPASRPMTQTSRSRPGAFAFSVMPVKAYGQGQVWRTMAWPLGWQTPRTRWSRSDRFWEAPLSQSGMWLRWPMPSCLSGRSVSAKLLEGLCQWIWVRTTLVHSSSWGHLYTHPLLATKVCL